MGDVLGRLGSIGALRAVPRALPGTEARARAAKPIKVLHLFKYFRPDFTGDGLYVEKLIPLLEREGIRSEVAADITRPGAGPSPARLFGRGRVAAFNPLLLLWFVFNAWRYDVVHLRSAIDRHFLYHIIARLSGCRVVQSCTLDDGIGAVVRGYRPRFQRLVRRLCGLINDVVAISPALYEDTLQITPKARTHLIPQGVTIPPRNASLRDAARTRFGFAPGDVVALFVGGLCARKDVRFLIDNIPDGCGRLQLLLVGPDLEPAYVDALRAAIAASPAAGRIHLAGYMEDPAPAYRAADLFVFASHMEGCPNVVLEAMAYALPIVSRHLPDTTDALIEHGRTGLLFQTPAEYQDAVRTLVHDFARRRSMGEAARKAVATAYDMKSVAARYADLYRRAA